MLYRVHHHSRLLGYIKWQKKILFVFLHICYRLHYTVCPCNLHYRKTMPIYVSLIYNFLLYITLVNTLIGKRVLLSIVPQLFIMVNIAVLFLIFNTM